jgi:ferritin
MTTQLNRQMKLEFDASHKYLAMACRFDEMGLKTLCKRFVQQSDEERGHAVRILRYLQEVGAKVLVDGVTKPPAEYDSVESIVVAALKSEEFVTQSIHELMNHAQRESDHATSSFLRWFVDEQVEEESSMRDLLNVVKLAGPQVLHVEAWMRHQMEQEGK